MSERTTRGMKKPRRGRAAFDRIGASSTAAPGVVSGATNKYTTLPSRASVLGLWYCLGEHWD